MPSESLLLPFAKRREPLAALSEFKEIRYGFLPTRKLSEVVRVCGEMREAGERPVSKSIRYDMLHAHRLATAALVARYTLAPVGACICLFETSAKPAACFFHNPLII